MDEYQRARRAVDRTRWAPLCLVTEEGKPYAYKVLREEFKDAVALTTTALRIMMLPK